MIRALEISDHHVELEKQHRQKTVYQNTRRNFPPTDKGTKQSQTCYNCGGTYPYQGRPCPATGKACHNCLKTGHFSRVCKSEHKQPSRKPRAPQNQYQSQANQRNTKHFLLRLQPEVHRKTATAIAMRMYLLSRNPRKGSNHP